MKRQEKGTRLSYEEEADVIQHADDSELLDNDVIVRYENGEVIGITIMNASKKVKEK